MSHNFLTKIAEMNLYSYSKSIIAFAVFFNIIASDLYAQSCVTFPDTSTTPKLFTDGSSVTPAFSNVISSTQTYTYCGTTASDLHGSTTNLAEGVITFTFNSDFYGSIEIATAAHSDKESFRVRDNTNNVDLIPNLLSGCLTISGTNVERIGFSTGGGVASFSVNNTSSISFFVKASSFLFDIDICKNICANAPVIPALSTTTISTVCPANTADLTSINTSNEPTNTTLTWHTSIPANDTNKISNPTAVTANTYYAAFYYASTGCYSDANGTGTTAVTVTNAAPVIPALSTTTIGTVCPANTADLTTITASNMPTNATLTWHTNIPASNANKISNPTAATAGTYRAAFYYASTGCFSDANGTGTTAVTVTSTTPVIPALSSTTIGTVCPANTANLTTITASGMPTNATLTWHANVPASNANKVSNPTAAAAGTYRAAFYYASTGCYSDANGTGTTAVTVTSTTCCNVGTDAPIFK